MNTQKHPTHPEWNNYLRGLPSRRQIVCNWNKYTQPRDEPLRADWGRKLLCRDCPAQLQTACRRRTR